MRDPSEPSAPEVPDFDLIRPIGSGGFGQVWLATNRTTGILRAIKLISLQTSGQSNPAAREISSITRLEVNLRCRHPNLLTIHHVGKTATHLFYVMDPADDISGAPASADPAYLPATLQTRLEGNTRGTEEVVVNPQAIGENLIRQPPPSLSPSSFVVPPSGGSGGKGDRSNLCATPGGPIRQIGPVPFSPEVCLDYARQLLAGLSALHAAGMVHRDVKPANCLFVGGQLKLADFGLLTEAHPLVSRVGTRKYMPPDGRMDMRADVYAAGLVIYEIITGLPVDDFPRLGHLSRRIAGDPILSSLLRLVLKSCEREPELRPADARAVLAELDHPAKTATRLPGRRWLAAGAVALIATAGMLAYVILPQKKEALVDVSFITVPYDDEANIYLDGILLYDPDQNPFTTPCTVSGLPARSAHVEFECKGFPRWDAGNYDLAKTQQIVSRRP
jgi:serine/threonine protein kinase